MAVRALLLALGLLAGPMGTASASGGTLPLQTAAPFLNRTYTGDGFTLSFPRAYTARPFSGGVALTAPGRGDVITANVLRRPAHARSLSPEAYARRFAPLNIQGAGKLLSFSRLTLAGGRTAWVGTWRGERGTPVGPLYLVPLDPGARNWLTLEAASPGDSPLLRAVAGTVRAGR